MIRCASMVLGALALTACATTVALSDRLPESAALAGDEGLVIGSIQVTTPSEITDPEEREMVEALEQRKLTATIRRYVRRLSDGRPPRIPAKERPIW